MRQIDRKALVGGNPWTAASAFGKPAKVGRRNEAARPRVPGGCSANPKKRVFRRWGRALVS